MFGFEQEIDSEVDLGGVFIAEVINNSDPKCLERILVRVLGVHDMTNTAEENAVWASHIKPSKSNSGEVPDIGDFVYVMFLQKDPMHILWLGWVPYIQG